MALPHNVIIENWSMFLLEDIYRYLAGDTEKLKDKINVRKEVDSSSIRTYIRIEIEDIEENLSPEELSIKYSIPLFEPDYVGKLPK